MALLNGDIMSEIQLRQRIASAKAVAREVPVTTLTGFTVESSAPVTTKASGVLMFDDEGNFVGVAPSDEGVVYCPYCKGNFSVKHPREVRFCGWCGARLEGDE